jgi:predicted Zn-dependent protease
MASEAPLRTALGSLPEMLARKSNVAAAARTQIAEQLSAPDLRKLADADEDLNARISSATDALRTQEQAAQAWHKALAEAVKQWDASLASLSTLDPEKIAELP